MAADLLERRTPAPEIARPMTVVWLVVNGVCVLQAIGFASRLIDPGINRWIGVAIALLAVPIVWALIEFRQHGAGWRLQIGPIAFLAFVVMLLVVDVMGNVEFRSPVRPAILGPYLVLFFGSIVLMGAPMLRVDRRRWWLTAASAALLVVAMIVAQVAGVG